MSTNISWARDTVHPWSLQPTNRTTQMSLRPPWPRDASWEGEQGAGKAYRLEMDPIFLYSYLGPDVRSLPENPYWRFN